MFDITGQHDMGRKLYIIFTVGGMDHVSWSEEFEVARRRFRVPLGWAQIHLSLSLYLVSGRVANIPHKSGDHIPEA